MYEALVFFFYCSPPIPTQLTFSSHFTQAEVWDLDILKSNHSTWPVDATDLKEGFITIKGHTAVSNFKCMVLHLVLPTVLFTTTAVLNGC